MGIGKSKPIELTELTEEHNNQQLEALKNLNITFADIVKNITVDSDYVKDEINKAFNEYKKTQIELKEKELETKKISPDELKNILKDYEELLDNSRLAADIKIGIPPEILDYLNKNNNKRIFRNGIADQYYESIKKLYNAIDTDVKEDFLKKFKSTISQFLEDKNANYDWKVEDIQTINKILTEISEYIDKKPLSTSVVPSTGTIQSPSRARYIAALFFATVIIISVITTIELEKTGPGPGPGPTGKGTTTINPIPSPGSISNLTANTIIAISALLANKISGCYLITNNGGNITTIRLEGCSDWYSGSENQMFCRCPSNETTTTLTKPDCSKSELSNYPFCIDSSKNPDATQCLVKESVLKDKTLYKCNGASIDQEGFVFYQYQYYPPTSVINTINNITQQLQGDDKKSNVIITLAIVLIIIAIISIVLYIMLNRSVKKIKRSSR
jgi:hypothetical protein